MVKIVFAPTDEEYSDEQVSCDVRSNNKSRLGSRLVVRSLKESLAFKKCIPHVSCTGSSCPAESESNCYICFLRTSSALLYLSCEKPNFSIYLPSTKSGSQNTGNSPIITAAQQKWNILNPPTQTEAEKVIIKAADG